ncbi:unnamed protein product [Lasius platythorax]|uniref:Uncharacterized protein n=1 Tax=Lasius platythorax TaxID=488582 RepID=A0AAV2NBC3_9HYME
MKVGLRLITFARDRCCPCDCWPFASLGYSVDLLSVTDLVTRRLKDGLAAEDDTASDDPWLAAVRRRLIGDDYVRS